MKRRRVLLTVGTAAGVGAIAGCSQLSRLLPGCDDMHSTTIDLEPVTRSDEQRSHLYPLVYSDLTADHQAIVDSATGDGRYMACPPVPEAAQSFVSLVGSRMGRQQREYEGDQSDPPDYLSGGYLQRSRSFYVLHVSAEDMVLSPQF